LWWKGSWIWRPRASASPMVGRANRKFEDRQNGIADDLVQQPVPPPYGLGAFIVEEVQKPRQLGLLHRLGKRRVAADVCEQDRGVYVDGAPLHNAFKHELADRTEIWVHLAGPDADHAERQR